MFSHTTSLLPRIALTAILIGHALPATASPASAPPAGAPQADAPQAGAPPADAPTGASDWYETKQASVRLISATEATGDNAMLRLGLQFELRPGWKVYWRSPGDAGYPPRVSWKRSENLSNAEFGWPAPNRFSVLGLETMGYEDGVVFPVSATLAEPGKPVKLRATVDFLTCDDICIPYSTDLALDLPAGPAKTTEFFQLIDRYQSRVPGDGTALGIAFVAAELEGPLGPIVNGVREGSIRVVAASKTPFETPDIFVEGPPELVFARPDITLIDDGRKAVLRVGVGADQGFELAGRDLKFTIVDGDRAAERALTVNEGSAGYVPGETRVATTLVAILGLAVIGGLILNLMPCVLPVLSLKLLSVVSHGGGDRGEVRLSFLASAAGILFSFLVLASAAVALKSAGAAVGWGIQFQQPLFLVALALILALFAYNMWGMYEIRLPSWLTGIAGSSGAGHGVIGHFATGAFATLLATPCSAPFLGTAVGFALARSAFDTYAVFAALSVGMAIPFLAVAAVPAVATHLPKPGRWMIRLKQVLGVALAATAVWLLSVLAVQVSAMAAFAVAALLVATGVVLYGGSKLSGAWRGVTAALLILLAAGAFYAPAQFPADDDAAQAVAEDYWQPFDQAAIPRLVAEGKTVFVDVTAEWCLTCQVNKAAVLNRGEVFERLTGTNVVAMKADWTRPNDEIAAYLASFGKYGIPFNVVYGPGAERGVVLPELLTSGSVMTAFDEASPASNLASE